MKEYKKVIIDGLSYKVFVEKYLVCIKGIKNILI